MPVKVKFVKANQSRNGYRDMDDGIVNDVERQKAGWAKRSTLLKRDELW